MADHYMAYRAFVAGQVTAWLSGSGLSGEVSREAAYGSFCATGRGLVSTKAFCRGMRDAGAVDHRTRGGWFWVLPVRDAGARPGAI